MALKICFSKLAVAFKNGNLLFLEVLVRLEYFMYSADGMLSAADVIKANNTFICDCTICVKTSYEDRRLGSGSPSQVLFSA